MKYVVEYTKNFNKLFKKLDKYTQKIIRSWINTNLVYCENPRAHGIPLKADKSGQWRYRIGDYRLICSINDNKLVVLALKIGHRRNVYDS